MGMTLLNELRSMSVVRRLIGLDSDQVKNGFFANYLTGLLLLKMQDQKGLGLIHDTANAKLTNFKPGMTDTTFWGRALFYPNDPLVVKALKPGHANLLHKEAGRILDSRVHKLINVLMSNPESVDWDELTTSLVMMRYRFELSSSYFNKIVLNLVRWESLSSSARRNTLSVAYTYLNQADPRSALLSRIRTLAGTTMISNIKAAAAKLVGIIKEDDGGGISTGNIATGDGGDAPSDNAIITRFGPENSLAGLLTPKKKSPNQVGGEIKMHKGKHLSIRQRKFKLIKFKMPTKKDKKNA